MNTLSGGERQSIAISRAMQFAAKLIILDEPTNNLGVEETHGVLRFVQGDARDTGHSCSSSPTTSTTSSRSPTGSW